ncbi:MAG TPA: ankyrin repeat domain-containing protein [Dokdonella sp.]
MNTLVRVLLAAVLLSAPLAHAGRAMSETDPSKVFADARTAALATAAADGDAARVKALVAAGADPNGRGSEGVTVLEWAMLRRSARGVDALLDVGADPNRPGLGGATALHVAAMADDPSYLKRLLERGADPNAPHGATGAPPLSAALMNLDGTSFDLLLAHRADPNRADRLGDTPLHVAAQVHKTDDVLKLLDAGADPTRRNQRGQTFQTYFDIAPAGGFSAAAQAKRQAVFDWLSRHGVPIEKPAH